MTIKLLSLSRLSPFLLYKCLIYLAFLSSLHAWFLWDLKNILIVAVGGGAAASFLLYKSWYRITGVRCGVILLLLLSISFETRTMNLNGQIAGFLNLIIFSSCVLLRSDLKSALFRFLSKGFAALLLISLLAFVVFLIGVPLPSSPLDFFDQYSFDNYYFFLNGTSGAVIPRFGAVFLEPGHMGMIAAFFLVANKFDLKKKDVCVIATAIVFSFSLAAYVLSFLGLLLLLAVAYRKVWYLVFVGLVSLGIYFGAIYYNGGENVVNELIISRLVIEDGDLKGNNRFSSDFEEYYSSFLKSDNVYLGIGSSEFADQDFGANAGYKVYIAQNGILGTISVAILYFALFYLNRSPVGFILLLVYVLSFLQRAYPLWVCEIVPFICALPWLRQKEGNI